MSRSPLGDRSSRAVVVGAGVAGAAAVFAAERAGHRVTWIDGGVGASALTSGALDLEPWEDLKRALAITGSDGAAVADVARMAGARAFVDAIGMWELPSDRVPLLATTGGLVRPTRGYDRALLDLRRLEGRRVLVPRVDRATWDADWLARAWTDEARSIGVTFVPVDVPVLRYAEEGHVVDGELATRHDDPARLAWLADRLAPVVKANGGAGVVLGPWLGVAEERATELGRRLGVAIGEALSGTAGTSGLRFEAARQRGTSAEIVRATAVRVEDDGSGLRVVLSGDRSSVRADVVVLALGGLVGGGVTYVPPWRGAGWDGPESAKVAFRVGIDAPDLVPSKLAGSMHGPYLDETAWPARGRASDLESAGALIATPVGADPRAIRIVGDARRSAPRTMLEAILSGLAAFAYDSIGIGEAPSVVESVASAR